MSKLPQISGRDCVKALQQADFHMRRQRGSHIIMRRDDPYAQVVVPDHKQLDRGTLRGIIRQAEMSVGEFVALL